MHWLPSVFASPTPTSLSVGTRRVVVMARTVSLAKRRKALQQASAALEGLEDQLWAAPGAQLGPLMELVDGLAARAAAARVAVLAVAVQRGEAGDGTSGAHAWLRDWARSL